MSKGRYHPKENRYCYYFICALSYLLQNTMAIRVLTHKMSDMLHAELPQYDIITWVCVTTGRGISLNWTQESESNLHTSDHRVFCVNSCFCCTFQRSCWRLFRLPRQSCVRFFFFPMVFPNCHNVICRKLRCCLSSGNLIRVLQQNQLSFLNFNR